MFSIIRTYQQNIMLSLSASCMTIACLLFITRFISDRRKFILIMMEFVAAFLLGFDRLAYVFSGVLTKKAIIMVRVSNFMVFFLTSAIVFFFNLFLMEILTGDSEKRPVPKRLLVVNVLSITGMMLAVIAAFTGLYYHFDEFNRYQRGPGFLIAYSMPVLCTLIQLTVVISYRKKIRRFIFIALILYIVVPVLIGIIQIFAYGLSITNMAMVLVSILLYVFIYLDVNDEVEKAHSEKLQQMEEGKKSMNKLFDQMARAFMTAQDERNEFTKGHSARVADYAKKLASEVGLNEKECRDAYFSGLLHDIGNIGLPSDLLSKGDDLTDEEEKIIMQKPLKGYSILSSITEYPELSTGARYCMERYDGSGYPDGLKGDEIPNAVRIVSIVDAYDNMTSRKSYRDPLPQTIVREELLKGAGNSFDPDYTKHMLRIIDADQGYSMREEDTLKDESIPDNLKCGEYRDTTMKGIKIENYTTVLRFKFKADEPEDGKFSEPAIILFDSYNGAVHNKVKTIKAYGYKEYAELWFNGHYNSTRARNIEMTTEDIGPAYKDDGIYEVMAIRQDDHIKLIMTGGGKKSEAIVALENKTAWAYIGLTGEHCLLSDITVTEMKDDVEAEGIRRIADGISYIDRIESDLPNIQIDSTRTVSTEGIPVSDGMRIRFHTMTLPMAMHIWHCPYIILFYSENGKVEGPGYIEYAMIKLNGEDDGSNEHVENSFTMKKTERFKNWDDWLEKNMAGYECLIDISRKGKRIVISTDNLGISIVNTSDFKDNPAQIYVSLTGDEVALTDIRIES